MYSIPAVPEKVLILVTPIASVVSPKYPLQADASSE